MNTARTLLLLAAGLVGACAGKSNPPAENPDGPKACTKEAKVCPDGSTVGRIGPNCEFAPCPVPEGDAPASDAPAPPPGEPQNAAPPSP
ncbi:hypothetical protein SAMN02745121_06367 [Nannocystis exedens]|uniref:Lipoprotein n=1 Tax=Nannocystis exedens TaxID=54 RepID=A0A1I2F1E6_9BACT|nr:hypothetical protein [Nannocystis exedens]PCC69560.1 hypothetical protein NAEX_02582 [Nannocystis exedens]SFE98340.1 hypothetical protein SAMN02745121_06367 [Nannocystis exedens]